MENQINNPFEQLSSRITDLENLINIMRNEFKGIKKEQDPNERLTRAEIKKQYKVSLGTIHNAMNANKLPFNKVGRKTLFKRVDVENWMLGNHKLN